MQIFYLRMLQFFCLYIEVLRHTQQFFSYIGTELWGVNVSCSKTQHGDASGIMTNPGPLDAGPDALPLCHRAPL